MERGELEDGGSPTAPVALPADVPDWPLHAVLVLSLAGVVSALLFRSFIPALVTYAVLLLLGCGLLFHRRRSAIVATRRAGGVGFVRARALDRVALTALVIACLANGLVIALETASWDWGA